MVKIINQLLPDVFHNRLLTILDDEDHYKDDNLNYLININA